MDYESIRKSNIERNQEFLRSIGLIDFSRDVSSEIQRSTCVSRGKKNRTTEEPSRRSSRVAQRSSVSSTCDSQCEVRFEVLTVCVSM